MYFILLLFIILGLWILWPRKLTQRFYDYKQINPSLEILKYSRSSILIDVDQLNDSDWQEWPEKDLYIGQDNWTIFPFYGFGFWVKQNCDKCPSIYKALQQIEGLRTASLSKLNAFTKLEPHRGWADLSNNVLRSHYGIYVPEHCYIFVEGEKTRLMEGEIIVFDDSKRHWATNYSAQERIVLIIDIERPSNVQKGQSTVQNTPELVTLIKRLLHSNNT